MHVYPTCNDSHVLINQCGAMAGLSYKMNNVNINIELHACCLVKCMYSARKNSATRKSDEYLIAKFQVSRKTIREVMRN